MKGQANPERELDHVGTLDQIANIDATVRVLLQERAELAARYKRIYQGPLHAWLEESM